MALDDETSYIVHTLEQQCFESSNTVFVTAPATSRLPDLLFFSPNTDNITCPICGNTLYSTLKYCTGENRANPPRLLYGLERNALLVSKIVRCAKNCGQFLAHDVNITTQLEDYTDQKFILLQRSGFLKQLYSLIVTSIAEGKDGF